MAVLASCAAVAGRYGVDLRPRTRPESGRLCAVLARRAGLALLGLIDDICPLPALPRLALQIVADDRRGGGLAGGNARAASLPLRLERSLLVLGGAWFINLTNFMDGMDWITVVDTVPLCLCLVVAWFAGFLPTAVGLLALGLVAGLVGFAPFNRPVARLFLGDVGSLADRILDGLRAVQPGGRRPSRRRRYPAALPGGRQQRHAGLALVSRQRVWEPHRNHFYQVAVARGLTVWRVLAYVAATNTILVLIAWSA